MTESKECPACGRDDFKSVRGMKQHHKMQHGESIAGEKRTCNECGDEFRSCQEQEFCSKSCADKYRRGRNTGEDHPRWKKRVTVQCDYNGCENTMTFRESEVDMYENRFCSNDCKYAHLSETMVNSAHPNWSGGPKIVQCDFCKDLFLRDQSAISRWEKYGYLKTKLRSRNFCSRDCFYNYRSLHNIHPGDFMERSNISDD